MEPKYLNILKYRSLANGSLSFFEFENLPFSPKRVYWISDVGINQTRGSHAHKKLNQFFFAMKGSCNINLFNGSKSLDFSLFESGSGVLVSPGWWRTLTNFSPGTIIQVFADLPFDEDDYIRNFEEFVALAKKKMSQPFFSFSSAPKALKNLWQHALFEAIETGIFINGPQKKLFELEFAKYCGSEFAIGVSNGLDGLIIALESCGIGPGKKVAVPNHTFIATWLAVHHVGAIPVGIAVDNQGLLDLLELDSKIDEIEAVIPVHMHGGHVDMVQLLEITKKKNLMVIEDASQCHGGTIEGKKIGTFGDAGVFSLYPTKNLGALGDAGIVITNSKPVADRIREISSYGSALENKYSHKVLGRNARMDEIQASILRINLLYLEEWNAHRLRIANEYELFFSRVGIPFLSPEGSIFHHFIIFSENRDILRDKLLNSGVTTEVYYPNPAYREYFQLVRKLNFKIDKNAEYISNNSIALPISQWLSLSSAKLIATLVVENYV